MFNVLVNLLKSNKLVFYSAVFFVGSMIVNFGNYIFNLLMARMLGVIGYGELQSLLSVLVIFSIPVTVVSTIVIKYTANFQGAGQLDKIYKLFKYFTRKMLIFGVLFFIFTLVISRHLADFLHLSSAWPISLLGGSILFSFLLLSNRGILQGVQKFKDFSINSGIEVFGKIVFAVLFVWLGFGLGGVVLGIIFGSIIAYLFSFLPIKFVFKYKSDDTVIDTKEIFKYFFPVFLTLSALTLFYTIDIILVKHFFSPELAGQYGGISILGRILFFVSGPILAVMFSLSAKTEKQSMAANRGVFEQSFILVSLISIVISAFYFLVPNLMVNILLGEKFLSIASYLGGFSIVMFLYTLISLLSQYFMSIHKSKFVYILLFGVALETGLINLWHSSLSQVILILNVVFALVLIGLLLYYFKISKDQAKEVNTIN